MHAPRRSTLQRLSALALMLAAGRLRSTEAALPRPASGRTRFEHDPFTLGVASGQPRPDSVLLWTRLAPHPHQPGGGMPPVPVSVTLLVPLPLIAVLAGVTVVAQWD